MLPTEQAVRGGVCAEQPCLPAAICKTAILALVSANKPLSITYYLLLEELNTAFANQDVSWQ